MDARNNVPGLRQAHDNVTEAVLAAFPYAPTGRRKRLARAAIDHDLLMTQPSSSVSHPP